MRIKNLLLILIAPLIGFAQSTNIMLLEKYEKSDWIGYKYFNNRVNDQLIVYRYVDSILSVKPDKSVNLNIKYYGKFFKKGGSKIKFDTTGIVDFQIYRGSISFPRRVVWVIGNISNQIFELVTKTDTINSEGKPTTTKNDKGLIISIKSNRWMETYYYDSYNQIVKIERRFNQFKEDSTEFRIFCLLSANKWIGQYDSKGNLIYETTYWDNGNEYTASYEFDNELLVKSEYVDIFKNNKLLKKYIYENGVLTEILIYNSKQKRIGRLSYKWK